MHRPNICFDLDGTLLDQQGRIHPNDVALLGATHPPAIFIPATGRPLVSVKRALARNHLFAGQRVSLPMVLQNGSLLFAEREAPLMYEPFEPAVQEELLTLSMQFKQVTFFYLDSSDIYVLWPRPYSMQLEAAFDFRVRSMAEYNGRELFSKVMCMSGDRPTLDAFSAAVEASPLERAFSLPQVLELTPLGINKATGIRKLLEAMHRETQDLYVAGDGENDLDMFEIASRSFAPSTAPAHIKARAGCVIDVSEAGLLTPMLEMAC